MWTAASLAGAGMRMTNSVYALCGAGIASIFAVLGATVGWGSLKGSGAGGDVASGDIILLDTLTR